MASVEKLVKTMHNVDMTIYAWNDILERSQPLIDGRVVFRFLNASTWYVDGKPTYLPEPVPGKMIKLTSGRWRFCKLDSMDHYDHIADLRVGKSYESDRLVKKLIDGIESLLKDRKEIELVLRGLRSDMKNRCTAISTKADKMFGQDLDLRSRIKLDWKKDAQGALNTLKEQNRLRNESKKAKRTQAVVVKMG